MVWCSLRKMSRRPAGSVIVADTKVIQNKMTQAYLTDEILHPRAGQPVYHGNGQKIAGDDPQKQLIREFREDVPLAPSQCFANGDFLQL